MFTPRHKYSQHSIKADAVCKSRCCLMFMQNWSEISVNGIYTPLWHNRGMNGSCFTSLKGLVMLLLCVG